MCVCVCVCVCVHACVGVYLLINCCILYIFFTVCVHSLYSQMTMEVILSTAFGRSVDVQGGKGGEIYDDARAVFNSFTGRQSMLIRILQFILSENCEVNVRSIVLRIIRIFDCYC